MTPHDTWTIINEEYDAHSLGQHNSVFTISNGYLGLKGNVAEDRAGYSPVTLVNGIYDELDVFSTIRASNEKRRYLDERNFDTAGRSPAVANLPDPLFVRLFIGDEEVTLTRGEISGFVQGLDRRSGVYSYQFQYRDGHGRTTRVAMTRFAALGRPHRVYMRYAVTPLDHDAPIRIHSGIDGRVYSNTTRERQFQVVSRHHEGPERCLLQARTPARQHTIDLAVANALAGATASEVRGVCEHDTVYTAFTFAKPRRGETITLDRFIAITTSEDARRHVAADLREELVAAMGSCFDDAQLENHDRWDEVWQRADVQFEGDDLAQRYLRFCIYHILAGAPWHTDTLPVPVKLLTGEYYQGNTFYDTDLYIVPAYLFLFPELARGALNFRHIGLEPGRAIARSFGYQGAKFAWQSGPNGEECLGNWWRFIHTNIHINGDVAYTLMQYYWATGDEEFMRTRGIDLLVETARFYASRAVYNREADAYDLIDVAGPDEGHCESTNNFYTNYLAQRNLSWAADMLEHLAEDDANAYTAAIQRLGLAADEPQRWRDVASRLTLLFDDETKVYEQCAGFYQLLPPPTLTRDRKIWFATVAPYQALNQPDVVMAMVMFRDEFPADVQRANWDFYGDKSMNFSSMSFVLNAIMAADMGEMDAAYENFIISAGEDIDEELTGRKDTYAGLHGTASGGAWMAAVFGFGGVHLSEQGLRITPNLPEKWQSLRFNLVIRGEVLRVTIDRQQVTVDVGNERGLELPVRIAANAVTLRSGQTCRVTYRS